MKSFKFLFMMLLSAAVLVGCKKKAAEDASNDAGGEDTSVPAGINFSQMAKDMCDCASPMMEMSKEASELAASGDAEKAGEMLQKLAGMEGDMEKCIAGLEAKYPGVNENEEYQEKAIAELEKQCPDFAAAMKEQAGE